MEMKYEDEKFIDCHFPVVNGLCLTAATPASGPLGYR